MAPLTQANLLRMKKLIYSFFALFILSVGYGQQITGNVSDQNGQPLPGVNITTISNSNSVSDFDGNFTINAISGEQLTFTMIGFTTKSAKASTGMKISLSEEVNMLNEVVAIGYGTKKAGTITGSVSQIKSAEILKTPAQSAIQAIQGKAAGINIVTNDEPGGDPTIRIRGLGTILGNRNPLYIINGVEAYSLNGLSPNDIETIDVLKDASSLAIYGQKGSNGVVLITTKKGKKGEIKISYNSFYGQKEILSDVKMADSYRFAYYNNTALGSSNYFNFNQPYNTNWLKEITSNGEVSSNSVSLSGANENTNYYLSLTHYTEDGILNGTKFRRTNIINKNEYKMLGDRLKVTHFTNLAISDNTPKPLNAFTNAYKQSPIMPVKYSNGRWGVPLVNTDNGINDLSGTNYSKYNNVANPVAQLYYANAQNKAFVLTGSLAAELKLLKDLTITSSFGTTAEWRKGYSYIADRDIYLSQNPFSDVAAYNATFGTKTPRVNTLEQSREDIYIWNWDNYLTYKKQFGNHELTVVGGISRTTSNNSEILKGTRYNVPEQTNYWYLNFATDNGLINPGTAVSNTHSTPIVSTALFARAEYGYMEKYLLTAIVRREGLSPFQGNKKVAVFPSISAGWVISNENFMKGTTFINNLKIRGGYGELGNGNGETYNNTTFTTGANYSFGLTPVIYGGAFVANYNDPNLTWEKMKEIDLGIDFSLLNSRITGTLDYYNRKSDDLILPVSFPLVISEEPTFINAGQITNKGFEVTLKWEDRINDNLRYWVGGNLSKNDNSVSRIDSRFFKNFPDSGGLGNGQTTKRVVLNQPLGSFYVYEQIGYNGDGAPIYNDMVDGVPGLNDSDRINAGSYIPDYTYGVNIGFNYKNVDFSVDGYGVGGNKIYNGKKAQRFGGENVEFDVLDSFWTPSTPNAANPKPNNDVPMASTYFIEDGAFFRINNITLGYTFPKMIEKVDKVRLYFTAVNPFIFTKYSGYSPEISGNENGNPLRGAGIELDAYPTNKTFLVGVNVGF